MKSVGTRMAVSLAAAREMTEISVGLVELAATRVPALTTLGVPQWSEELRHCKPVDGSQSEWLNTMLKLGRELAGVTARAMPTDETECSQMSARPTAWERK